MVVSIQQYLKLISALLNVPLEKSSKSSTIPGNTITSSILSLLNKSGSKLNGNNNVEKAEIQQWVEYFIVYVAYIDSSQNVAILSTLNEILTTRTYLVAQRLTIADVLLYYILYDFINVFSYVEKEKYIHISRWFDNIQRNKELKHSNKLIDFRSNYVATLVPSKH